MNIIGKVFSGVRQTLQTIFTASEPKSPQLSKKHPETHETLVPGLTLYPATPEEMSAISGVYPLLSNSNVFNVVQVFQEISPEGLLVGKIDNKVVSSMICLYYDKKFAYLSLSFVDEGYRRRGIGKAQFMRALEIAIEKKCEYIYLDSVSHQIKNYEKWGGFQIVSTNNKKRCKVFCYQPQQLVPNSHIVADKALIDIQELVEYDSRIYQIDRARAIRKCAQLGYPIISLNQNQEIQGYAMLMESTCGLTITPLMANNYEIAQDLVKACIGFGRGFKPEKFGDTLGLQMIGWYEKEDTEKLVEKWFPDLVLSYPRMVKRTEYYSGRDFDRSKMYGNMSYELG